MLPPGKSERVFQPRRLTLLEVKAIRAVPLRRGLGNGAARKASAPSPAKAVGTSAAKNPRRWAVFISAGGSEGQGGREPRLQHATARLGWQSWIQHNCQRARGRTFRPEFSGARDPDQA